MYNEFCNNNIEVLVYRTQIDEYVKNNKLETLIPSGTLVAYDGERDVIWFGHDMFKYDSNLFVTATRSINFHDITFCTKDRYQDIYTEELNEKAGFSDAIVFKYGDVDVRDGTICSNLIDKGIKFSIRRMD